MNKILYLISLGCTKNLVDSEIMLGKLKDYTISNNSSIADVIIINSCGFIESAKEESINTILEIDKIRKKNSLLIVAGCLSERYKEELKFDLPEVDLFTGVGDYDKIDEIIDNKESRFSNKIYLIDENDNRLITGSNFHSYIKISEGCNQECSFCAIPKFKGKLYSRTLKSIEKEVFNLVKKGFYEFTFISQDSSSYGRDIGIKDGLIELINKIENIKGVKLARILYLYPSTTTYKLIDTISDSKIFQTYFDMPIQHIDNNVLKSMKRGFGEKKLIDMLKYMRNKKNSFLRTSFIAGYPSEDEKSFNRLVNFLNNFNFDRFNTFSYSHEEDTKAYNLQQLSDETIFNRSEILGDIALKQTDESLTKLIGKKTNIIVEKESEEHSYLLSGRDVLWGKDIDGDILINDTNNLIISFGNIYEAEITELVDNRLLATLIKKI